MQVEIEFYIWAGDLGTDVNLINDRNIATYSRMTHDVSKI